MRAVLALVALLALAGCRPGPTTSADCSTVVRYEGVEYVGYGWTEHAATRLGSGEESGCDDNGPDAAGATWDDATPVTVLKLRGVDPTEAVGLRVGDEMEVMVSRELSGVRRDALLERLS